jgi:phage shock protein A
MTRAMTDSELMDLIEAVSLGLAEAEERIDKLERRVRELEQDTPQARQLQAELDATLADNAAAGYGEWGAL